MPKPITPLVGCDIFLVNERHQVLLVRRSDNGYWCLPGGCQDLGETPQQCAVRECREETGLFVTIDKLLGVFSSCCYEYENYPWRDNEFTHLLFLAQLTGGEIRCSAETTEIQYFDRDKLPPLSDGHLPRITFGFNFLENPTISPYFE